MTKAEAKARRKKAKTFKTLNPSVMNMTGIQAPKIKELRSFLKQYVSPSISERLNALSSVFLWYEDALPFVMADPTLIPVGSGDAFKKAVEISEKARNHAIGTNNLEERDTALRLAIKQMEKCFVNLDVPKLDSYIALYDKKKNTFESRSKNLLNKFGPAVSYVEKALGFPFNIYFCKNCQSYIDNEQKMLCEEQQHTIDTIELPLKSLSVESRKDIPRRLNPSLQTYFYNKQAAASLYSTMRVEGSLPVLIRELRTLSRQASAVLSLDGSSYIVDRDRLLAIYERALQNIEDFIKSNKRENFKLLRNNSVVSTSVVSNEVTIEKKKTGTFGRARQSSSEWFFSLLGGKQLGPFTSSSLAIEAGANHYKSDASNITWNRSAYIARGAYRITVRKADKKVYYLLYTKEGQSVFAKGAK